MDFEWSVYVPNKTSTCPTILGFNTQFPGNFNNIFRKFQACV